MQEAVREATQEAIEEATRAAASKVAVWIEEEVVAMPAPATVMSWDQIRPMPMEWSAIGSQLPCQAPPYSAA